MPPADERHDARPEPSPQELAAEWLTDLLVHGERYHEVVRNRAGDRPEAEPDARLSDAG